MRNRKYNTTADTSVNSERRAAVKRIALAGLGMGSVAATAISSPRVEADSHLSKLDQDSPQAKALGYKHDAQDVDPDKFPQRQGGNKICSACRLYAAVSEDGWGACPIFAGKLVSGNGWCSAWVAVDPS